MPHYISLMRWTSQGMAGLPAWRERVEEGERIIEEAGGSLIGVYVTLGRMQDKGYVESRTEELYQLETLCNGRPITETRAQLGRLPEWYRYNASLLIAASCRWGGFDWWSQLAPGRSAKSGKRISSISATTTRQCW